MSTFYCDFHDQLEDADFVGFNEQHDGTTVCDLALEEVHETEQEILERIVSQLPPDARRVYNETPSQEW